MIIKNNKTIASVMSGNKAIQIIKKGLITVYEAWKDLIVSGTPPLTLTKSKGEDLIDYKIHGESVQGDNLFKKEDITEIYVTETAIRFGISYENLVGKYKFTLNGSANDIYVKKIIDGVYQSPQTVYSGLEIEMNEGEILLIYATQKDFFDNYSGYSLRKMPTPETPIEVESVGDKTKNLININGIKGSSYTINGNKLTVKIGAGNSSVGTDVTLKELCPSIEAGKTYTISFLFDAGSENQTAISIGSWGTGMWKTGTSRTITEADLTSEVRMGSTYNNAQSRSVKFSNIQIEEGTVATEYEPYGYRIPVKSSGKNLLDFSNMKLINTTNTAVRGGWIFEFNEDIDITISYGGTETLPPAILLAKKVTDGVYGSNIQLTTNTKTISLKKNEKLLVFVGSENVDKSYKMLADYGVTWIQVEIGDTATEYEPYIEPITTNIYLDEPLRKIGNYADYIDFKKQQVIRRIKETTISLLTNLQKLSDVYGYYRYETVDNNFDKLFTEQNTKNLFCTALSVITYPEYANNSIAERTNMNYIRILTTDYATLEELNQAIGNEKVYYVLAEESPSNIELPNIPTHKGTTILEVDKTIQPSNVEVIYKGKR